MLDFQERQPPVPLWLLRRPRFQPPIQLFKLSDLLIIFTLLLAILACTFSAYTFGQTEALVASIPAGSAYHSVSKRNTLPTLTPTLTQPQLAGTVVPPAPANGPGVVPVPYGSVPQQSAALPAVPSTSGSGLSLPSLPPASSSGLALPTFSPGNSSIAAATLPAVPTSSGNPVSLPTLAAGTPTVAATATPTATVAASPPTPTAAPTPATGWSFASVRVYTDQEDGLLLYGKLTNDTGAPQELEAVTGLFYNEQGQVIADDNTVFDDWPINVVPPGGMVPFELNVFQVQSVANFDLRVEAQPSGENTRQDFEFVNTKQRVEDGDYCLEGDLRNNGDELRDYLVIVAILYDGQGNVVNFDYYDEYDPASIRGDQASSFDICVPPPNGDVANHELRAWGQ